MRLPEGTRTERIKKEKECWEENGNQSRKSRLPNCLHWAVQARGLDISE